MITGPGASKNLKTEHRYWRFQKQCTTHLITRTESLRNLKPEHQHCRFEKRCTNHAKIASMGWTLIRISKKNGPKLTKMEVQMGSELIKIQDEAKNATRSLKIQKKNVSAQSQSSIFYSFGRFLGSKNDVKSLKNTSGRGSRSISFFAHLSDRFLKQKCVRNRVQNWCFCDPKKLRAG